MQSLHSLLIRKDDALRCRTFPLPGRDAIVRDDYSLLNMSAYLPDRNDFRAAQPAMPPISQRAMTKTLAMVKRLQTAIAAASKGSIFNYFPKVTERIRYIVSPHRGANMGRILSPWETDHDHC